MGLRFSYERIHLEWSACEEQFASADCTDRTWTDWRVLMEIAKGRGQSKCDGTRADESI